MWDKITLYQFREINKVSNSKKDEEQKILATACIFFNLTEYQISVMPPEQLADYLQQLNMALHTPIKSKPRKRIGRYLMNYRIDKMTFGQYIEIAYFLQQGHIQSAHQLLATAATGLFSNNHMQKADYFLNLPVSKTIGSVKYLLEKFSQFNKRYSGLFGLSDGKEENIQEVKKEEQDPFNKQYGWFYSAELLLPFKGNDIDRVYKMKATEALNMLGYLKGKGKYLEKQLNKKK